MIPHVVEVVLLSVKLTMYTDTSMNTSILEEFHQEAASPGVHLMPHALDGYIIKEVGGAGHSKQKQQQPTPIHQDQIYQNVNAFWTLTPVLNGTHA